MGGHGFVGPLTSGKRWKSEIILIFVEIWDYMISR